MASELENQIDDDLAKHLKAGDADTVRVLRSMKSAFKNASIEYKGELTDEQLVRTLQQEAKKRREAAELYEKSGRKELASGELAELDIIVKYLPKQLTDDELGKIVDNVIQDTGASTIKDMGMVMGKVIAEVKGQADGSRVSAMVKEKLTS